MKRTTVFLDEDLLRRLKMTARAQGTSFAGVVREALVQYLARGSRQGTRLPSVAGAFESEFADTGERAEELLGEIMRRNDEARPR